MRYSLVIDRIDSRQRLPRTGDVVTTKRWAYRVIDLEKVQSRAWHDRWRLDLDRLGTLPVDPSWVDTDEHRGCRQVAIFQYQPGETPADIAERNHLPSSPPEGHQLALVDAPPPADPDVDPACSEARYLEPNPIVASAPAGLRAIADIRARLHGPTTKEPSA